MLYAVGKGGRYTGKQIDKYTSTQVYVRVYLSTCLPVYLSPCLLFPSSSSSTRFRNSSMDLFAGVFMGLLNESFNADIQREFPPFAQPRAIAYITKFTPTTRRIMINKPIAAFPDSMICTYTDI